MPYPDRPGEPDCIFCLRIGLCGYGNICRFNHPTHIGQANQLQLRGELPERVGEPDCVYFLNTGTCKYGLTCKYNHPRDRRGAGPVVLNMVGLPTRQEEKTCAQDLVNLELHAIFIIHSHQWMNLTFNCHIHHNHHLLSMVVLHGHYLGQHMFLILVYRLLKLIYQLFFLILKELGPHKEEHLHGSLSSVSSGSIYGGLGSIEQPYSSGSTNMPKRPSEPECRYFMHTGNCKYGSDCKYHHPKEKIAQLAASSLGPLGLPLRPGQAVCSYYSLYGICKFEPTYKYDHPLMGYSYNYNMSLPNDNANAPSLFSYGRVNSSTLHSSGSSLSKSSKNEGAKTPGGGSPSPSPQRAASPSHSE